MEKAIFALTKFLDGKSFCKIYMGQYRCQEQDPDPED
jgi:hypothetical protein